MGSSILSSSCIHLIVSTTPFLILFSYLIYAAHSRPAVLLKLQQQEQEQQVDDDALAASQNADRSSSHDGLIPLMDMLQMTLVTLVCWAWFVSYLFIFVPNRRKLMKRYKKPKQLQKEEEEDEEDILEIIGDVYYDRPKGILGRIMDKVLHTDLAYVTYKYPIAAGTGRGTGRLQQEEDHTANNNAMKRNKGQQTDVDGSIRFVEKKIRTYHPYHRENVAIWVLKGFPLSGQPKADIERDVASFESETALRNQKNRLHIILVAIGWMVFLVACALYIIHQIGRVESLGFENQKEEDVSLAWIYFSVYLMVVLPIVAIGLNYLQWTLHFWWVTQGGKVTMTPTKIVPKVLHGDDLDQTGGYIAMI